MPPNCASALSGRAISPKCPASGADKDRATSANAAATSSASRSAPPSRAFRYRFEDWEITDAFLDATQGPSLTRTLTLSQPASPDLYLRLAADKDLKPGDVENTYALPQKLLLVTPPGATLLSDGELRLPLAGKQASTLEYRFQAE